MGYHERNHERNLAAAAIEITNQIVRWFLCFGAYGCIARIPNNATL
jgi:hypothetical protein